MGTLVISEKNISARRIAQILSNGKCKQIRINGVPIYQFDDNGRWDVIGLRGHIMKLDYPSQYNGWTRIAPAELIKIQPERKVAERAISQTLSSLCKDKDHIIIATDYDREGELIGVESLDVITNKVSVQRAHFSSLTPSDVQSSFKNLKNVDYNLAYSAQARQMIDLMWGASLTRFISLISGQLGRDFLSVGRVQTPTLALIVDREKEIKNFIPVPFWILEVEVKINNSKFKIQKGKIFQESKATALYDHLKKAATGEVAQVTEEIKDYYPPPPFNTTMFLETASTHLGLSASQAMEIAEGLYMKGLISYPRTDNTIYPPSLPIKKILNTLKSTDFSPEVTEVLTNGRQYPTKGTKKATDHPPIHPVAAAQKKSLDKKQWVVYELVVRRFLATLAKNSKFKIMDIKIDINGEIFQTKGQQALELNWKAIYPYIKTKERILPFLKTGDILTILKVNNTKSETKPPKRYSQGTLIAQMEKKLLGTKSTRHEIIKKLYSRKYVTGKSLIPTPPAIAVTDALEKNAQAITSPNMTANLENDMDKIAEGKKDFQHVFQESQTMLESIMTALEEKKHEIGSSIKKALAQESYIGTCPQCGGNLRILTAKKRFLGCSNYPKCTNSYPLPQKGKILFTDKYCTHCKAPIIKVIARTPWETCVNMNCPGRAHKKDTKT